LNIFDLENASLVSFNLTTELGNFSTSAAIKVVEIIRVKVPLEVLTSLETPNVSIVHTASNPIICSVAGEMPNLFKYNITPSCVGTNFIDLLPFGLFDAE
jgi:hypothetical protein